MIRQDEKRDSILNIDKFKICKFKKKNQWTDYSVFFQSLLIRVN